MDSALEQQRLYHEEIERISRACIDEMMHLPKSVFIQVAFACLR
jgi:hypothetical protein